MKQGIRGGATGGCCKNFEVWGIRTHSPNWLMIGGTQAGTEVFVPYDFEGNSELQVLNDFGNPITKDVVPEITTPVAPQVFPMHVVKVPSSYPYDHCDRNAAIDSGDESDQGDGTFEVGIGIVTEHKAAFDPEFTLDYLWNWRFCFSIRAIYVDLVQRYISCRIGGQERGTLFDAGGPCLDGSGTGGLSEHGDHCLVDINTEELMAQYYTADNNSVSPETLMEQHYNHFFPFDTMYSPSADDNVGSTPNSGKAYAANCESFGKEYYIVSGYTPEATQWGVARVKYVGTRLGETMTGGTPSVPSMEVFSTGCWAGGHPAGNDNGSILTAEDYENEHVILLPSCRVFIDSAAAQPDECWVIALKTFGDPELVTGRWLGKVYRPGVGTADEVGGVADGTLAPDEIENTILPTAQTDADFPDEGWNDIRVRGYNHIAGKDYILLTTEGEPELAEPLADFEQPEGFDPDYLNNGLDEHGLSFTTYGTRSGDKWIADAGDKHGGTYGARTNEGDVTTAGQCTLSIQAHVTETSDLTFWFRLDNRWYGTRVPPFVTLTNFPDVDNQLRVYVDGVLATMTIDFGAAHGSIGPEEIEGVIDNNFFDDEPEYLAWYQATITLPPGTHTIRWTLVREWQDNGHLVAWLDDIQFPELLIGDDIAGRRRYYYDGTKLRRAEHWDWAQRDKENETPLTGRVSTEPDFITYDWYRERIYYCNPHALVSIRMDVGHEGELDLEFGDNGYVRWTASPNTTAPSEPPCYDPDMRITLPDVAQDAPWGGPQILVARHSIQVRGANASVKDINCAPFSLDHDYSKNPELAEQYKFYCQVRGLQRRWSMRISCWTLKDHGKLRVPHVQVINRPTWSAPAWPEKPPYANPPYQDNFEDWNGIVGAATEWNHFRMREERALADGSTKPRWSPYNWIVPRDYSDAFSRSPQFVWVRSINDPPTDPEDPDWWDPDAAPGGNNNGPWQSAIWYLVQAHFCPTGIRTVILRTHMGDVSWGGQSPPNELCPPVEDPEEPGPEAIIGRITFPYFWPFVDFDIVDCDCDCCGDAGPLVLPPMRPGTTGGDGDENVPG